MKTKKPLLSVLTATFCVATAFAQGQIPNPILEERIAVTARPSADSVMLRWAPLNYRVWRAGNEKGYRVERYLVAQNGHLLLQPERVILQPAMKPKPEEQWKILVETDRYAAIAAQALFGDRFEVNLKESDVFTIVNKVKENDQRFAFALFSADMSPATAKACGLWFTDRQVNKGEKYLYRIVINSMDSLRGNTFLSADDPYLLPEPQNLKAEFKDQLVSFRWDRNESINYTAYRLERSEDGRRFASVSEAPLVTVSPLESGDTRYEYATDSVKELSKIYYYRIRGITPFGEESPPSAVVSGKAIPSVGQVPYISSVENFRNTTLEVAWTFPKENNSDIKGFEIERALKPGDRYTPLTSDLLPPHARSFRDTNPKPVNYYRVSAIGQDDHAYASQIYFAQLIDSIPPVLPAGLQGKIDDNGTVTLRWKPNEEPDIYGYRVYKAYRKSEELAQITSEPIKEDFFNDQLDLHTLNETVYYSVMAIDQNQNHSALSPLVRISLPDKVRPQPPVLLPLQSTSSGVSLRWRQGGSEDITRYAVYRKSPNESEWERLAIIPAESDTLFSYTDAATTPGETNAYTVISVDDAGLESEPARPASGSKLKNSLAEPVSWKKPLIHKEENQITLRWNYEQQTVRIFRIFRAVDHQSPVLLMTLDGGKKEFTDTMAPGRHYTYRIIAVFENGIQSSLSEELKFQY